MDGDRTPASPRIDDAGFRRGLIAVVAVALVVRAIYLLEVRAMPLSEILIGDAKGYDAWAREIAAGDWIGTSTFYQAPLYPYVLAVLYKTFGADAWVARIAQAVLGAAGCGLVALAGRAWLTPRAGLLAAALLAVYPPAIFFDGILQKASLDLVFMALVLWLLGEVARGASRRFIVAAGAALAGFALTRENALVFAPIVAVWLVLRDDASPRRWREGAVRAAWLAAGLGAVLVPVGVRNLAVGGEFLITTSQAGPNFYIGNNARANGRYVPLRSGRETFETERKDATELAQAALGRALTPGEVSRYWWGRALDFVREEPGAWARLLARKFLLVWNRAELPDTESFELYRDGAWTLRIPSAVLGFGTLLALAAAGVVVTWPERGRLVLLHALALGFAVAVAAFYVFARYRYPLVPILALFAGAGLAQATRRSARRERRAYGPAAAAAAAALVLAWLPVVPAGEKRPADYVNVGVGFAGAGRFEEALAWYGKALAIRADDPDALYDSGVALAALGRRAEARAAYGRVLEVAPARAEAHANLGVLLAADGDLAQARAHLEEAARLEPGSAIAVGNLGNLAALEGRDEEAERLWGRAAALDPAAVEVRLDLARRLAETGRREEAAARYREVLAIRPDDAEARDGLAALGLPMKRK